MKYSPLPGSHSEINITPYSFTLTHSQALLYLPVGSVTPNPLLGQKHFQKTTSDGAGRTFLTPSTPMTSRQTTKEVSSYLMLRSQLKGIFHVSFPTTSDKRAFYFLLSPNPTKAGRSKGRISMGQRVQRPVINAMASTG